MRAFIRVIGRSPCVAAAAKKLIRKDASGIGCLYTVSDSNLEKGITRNSSWSFPANIPSRWCSSKIPEQTDGADVQSAAAPVLDVVKGAVDYASQIVQTHPEALEAAAYFSAIVITCYVLPGVIVKIGSNSVMYKEFEKCIGKALLNTQGQFFKYYPIASFGLLAFSYMSVIVAPSFQVYLPQLWEGASIMTILSFLNIMKENFISEAKKEGDLIDPKCLSQFDKISSGGLLALGILGIAEVGGLSLQSLLTLSGAGGVVTAFAGRDIIGNMLNGFILQFTEPFIVGDYIKAGSVEGTVVEIGLTCTSLVNQENLPLTVANSYFLTQVIVNTSRADVRFCVKTIPIKFEDVDKILALTREVNLMLKSNRFVTRKRAGPSCYVSRVGKIYGELVVSYETQLDNEALTVFEQDILFETLKMMRSHGVEVGDPLPTGDLEALLEAAKIIKSREASSYIG